MTGGWSSRARRMICGMGLSSWDGFWFGDPGILCCGFSPQAELSAQYCPQRPQNNLCRVSRADRCLQCWAPLGVPRLNFLRVGRACGHKELQAHKAHQALKHECPKILGLVGDSDSSFYTEAPSFQSSLNPLRNPGLPSVPHLGIP